MSSPWTVVVRDQIEAAHVALQMQHQRVVAGAIVRLENIRHWELRPSDQWHSLGPIVGISGVNRLVPLRIGEAAISVIALLVHVIGAQSVQCSLKACCTPPVV